MKVNFFVLDDFSEKSYRVINSNYGSIINCMFNMPIGSMVRLNGNVYRVGAMQWLDMDKKEPEQFVELIPSHKWTIKN